MTLAEVEPRIVLSLPTFTRPGLLSTLLEDLIRQSLLPGHCVIVDGDPVSEEVANLLARHEFPKIVPCTYVPSNHANLPYQRYLGYLVARKVTDARCLMYFDDDLRVEGKDAIRNLALPLLEGDEVVGITGRIVMEVVAGDGIAWDSVRLRGADDNRLGRWFRRWVPSRNVPPGGLTSVGTRVPPEGTGPYSDVEWLSGGAMAISLRHLSEDCFPDDLFAVAEVGAGLGEDTIISLLAGRRGGLVYAHEAVFRHPNADTPKAYGSDAGSYGWAAAYSRRLINDIFCETRGPGYECRAALVRHYLALLLTRSCKAAQSFSKSDLHFLLGTTRGVIEGLFRSPRSSRICPRVDWRSDAAAAIEALFSCV